MAVLSQKPPFTISRTKICEKDNTIFQAFCTHHSAMQIAQVCLENVSPHQVWSTANNFPDLVSRLHVQIRLMENCGLNSGIPWLSNTDGAHCFFCKESIEDMLVISSLIVQNSKIILNLCGLL